MGGGAGGGGRGNKFIKINKVWGCMAFIALKLPEDASKFRSHLSQCVFNFLLEK